MGSGGWTRQRLAVMTGLGLVVGLVATVLASRSGPWAVILAIGALITVGRAIYPRIQRALAAEERRQQKLRARAEQQHRWATRGDARGVYGATGAELMRKISPDPVPEPPGEDLEVARVVQTGAELQRMLADKPPCWRYAAFVSVLVQRRAAVQTRVRDARMGFAPETGERIPDEVSAALFFYERLADLSDFVDEINDFMLSPAFQEVFGEDEESADADGIVHAANRMMDYHDRALAVSERCRAARVPTSCRDLQRDFCLLTVLPLDSFTTFIEDFSDRISEAADVARYATGNVQLDPVEFAIEDDADILDRVSRRLQEISRRA